MRFWNMLCIFLLFMLAHLYASTILSIDMGSEFVKVFYVAPGSSSDPFPILLDRSSARKFPNLVGYLREEIQIGTKAVDVLLNKPEYAYPWIISNLLGRTTSDPLVKQWQSMFSNPTKSSKDGRLLIKMEKNWVDTEFLIALLLKDIKENAESALSRAIQGALITIPANFGPRQRMAIKQASEIAGLPLLGLVKSTEAAAIQYMLSKKDEKKENVLILDSGASSTTAILAEIGKGSIQIKETRTDASISGHAIDLALMNRLMSQHRLKPKSHEWYRLLSEVQKNKRTISISGASKNLIVDMANGKGTLTFRLGMEDIQTVCQSLLPKLDKLLEEGEKGREGRMEQQQQQQGNTIILSPIGSTMRFPIFMKHLEKKLGGGSGGSSSIYTLDQGLNNEEAVARGGAYLATKLYGRFKIKDFQFRPSDTLDWVIDDAELVSAKESDSTFMVKGPAFLIRGSNIDNGSFGPFMSVNIKDDLPPTFSSNVTLSIDTLGMPFVKRIQAKFLEGEQEKNKFLQFESTLLTKNDGQVSDASIKEYKKWIEDYDKKNMEKIEISDIRNELESKMFSMDSKLQDQEYSKWLTIEEMTALSDYKNQIDDFLSKQLPLEENKKLLKSIQTLENEGTFRKSKRQEWQNLIEEISKLSLETNEQSEQELIELYDKLISKKNKISDALNQVPLNQSIELGFSLKDVKDVKSEFQQKQVEIMIKKQLEEMKKKQEAFEKTKKANNTNTDENVKENVPEEQEPSLPLSKNKKNEKEKEKEDKEEENVLNEKEKADL